MKLTAILAGATGLLLSTANAASIGDQVTVANIFDGSLFEGPVTVTVTDPGAELFGFGTFWTVDLDESGVLLTCDGDGCDAPAGATFLADDVYGFDWLALEPGVLDAATLAANCTCAPELETLSQSRFTITLFGGSTVPTRGDTISVRFPEEEVPLPAAGLLFGSALLGASLARRRRAG